MNTEIINVLSVLAYFLFGTVGIVLLMAWALKHFGHAKRGIAKRPKANHQRKTTVSNRFLRGWPS